MPIYPRFASFNLLSAKTAVPGNDGSRIFTGVSYPVQNLTQQHQTVGTRSIYQSIVITTGQNDWIDFVSGHANIQLIAGQYRPAECAQMIKDLLGVGWTVTHNVVSSNKFNINGPTHQLSRVAGTHRSASALQTLGFDCSSNPAAAANSLAEFESTTTGGRFVIPAGGLVLRIDGQNITIPAGTYSAKSLTTAIHNAIHANGTLTDDYDVQWLDLSHATVANRLKFAIKRRGGTYTISWLDAATTIEDVLGYTANDTSVTANNYSLSDEVRIHTDEEYVWDFGSGNTCGQMDAIYYVGNHTADSVVTVQANATNAWTSPTFNEAFTYHPGFMVMGAPSSVFVLDNYATPANSNQRFVRLLIQDKKNPAGYVETGLIAAVTLNTTPGVAAVGTGGFTLSHNYNFSGNEESTIGIERVNSSDSGHKRGESVSDQDLYTYQFGTLSRNDKNNLKAFDRAVGTGKPFLCMMDLEGNQYDRTYWAQLYDRLSFPELPTTAERYSTVLRFHVSK